MVVPKRLLVPWMWKVYVWSIGNEFMPDKNYKKIIRKLVFFYQEKRSNKPSFSIHTLAFPAPIQPYSSKYIVLFRILGIEFEII